MVCFFPIRSGKLPVPGFLVFQSLTKNFRYCYLFPDDKSSCEDAKAGGCNGTSEARPDHFRSIAGEESDLLCPISSTVALTSGSRCPAGALGTMPK